MLTASLFGISILKLYLAELLELPMSAVGLYFFMLVISRKCSLGDAIEMYRVRVRVKDISRTNIRVIAYSNIYLSLIYMCTVDVNVENYANAADYVSQLLGVWTS